METFDVVVFKPFPFEVGQKIHIDSGPRRGDWEVVGISEHKVTLKCPVTGREVKWDRFCYFVEQKIEQWPSKG
ncbi:MAG TPA: hypothetical protein EYP06_00285 [Desulfobacterales bacterium]|nr:hypothetical protein [Desulfobacterales bacterium]